MHRSSPLFRSLYGKLALALLVLLGIIGVLYILVTLVTTRMFLQEVNQNLDRDVAEHLVSEVILMEDGEVNEEALKDIFHMMMVINPSIEIYLLDPEGAVLAYSAPPGKVRLDSIRLEPVERFLEGPANLPVTGDDPRHPGVEKAFSAAPIVRDDRLEGYLYVVLGGEQYDSAVQMLEGSYVLRLGVAALVAGLLFALVAGLLLFSLLTRRLRKLAGDMEAFQRSGFTRRVDAKPPQSHGRGDEIDRLRSTFDEMADRMANQLRDVKRADRLRRELVANVSHDLRTPLASLRGYLETLLLKEGKLSTEEQHRYLQVALQHSESLGNLVAELFELAKLESSETQPHPEPFALGELVQDVIQKYQLEADRKGIRLEGNYAADVPFVLADIGLIERVFENLLGNALRFTPEEGKVAVSLSRSEKAVAVEVADTGCGIPAEELPYIFDRFYRSKSGSRADHGGSGLGLAISKKILDLHGSRIEVRSTEREGTTFTFQLPTHTGSPA
jgi:signal transduction histidine kinase